MLLLSYLELNFPNDSWAVSIMWFTGSFTNMMWATYASFCEPFDRQIRSKQRD